MIARKNIWGRVSHNQGFLLYNIGGVWRNLMAPCFVQLP